MLNPLPTVNYDYLVLIQQKNQCILAGSISSNIGDVVVMYSSSSNSHVSDMHQNNIKDLQCLFCVKKGRRFDKCCKKYGVVDEVRKHWNTQTGSSSSVELILATPQQQARQFS